MILEILSYRLSLREGGSFAADDEAISFRGKVGDCFGKERLAATVIKVKGIEVKSGW